LEKGTRPIGETPCERSALAEALADRVDDFGLLGIQVQELHVPVPSVGRYYEGNSGCSEEMVEIGEE
jgi:hypothetical protein